MAIASPLTGQQKTLASCGIFLFVGAISMTFAVGRPSLGQMEGQGVIAIQTEQMPPSVSVQSDEVAIPENELQYEQNVPEVTTPQATLPETTIPVSTGGILQEGSIAARFLPALQSQQIGLEEDFGWDRSIFDTILPFASMVQMRSYVLTSGGQRLDGRVTQITALDPQVSDVYAYILMLARRDTSGKIQIEEKTYGQNRVFFYNDLDKKENVRILVQVNDNEAYAIDVPAYLQSIMDAVLSQL